MAANWILNKVIEVNANDLWDTPDHVNARFCQEHARASNNETGLFFMDGDYAPKIQEAEDFGCTPDFVKVYQEAQEEGCAFVLFYHDV